MRFHSREDRRPMRPLLALVAVLCTLGAGAQAQDRHDWQSVAQLHPGDRIRVSLKSGPVDGAFQNFTPEQVTVGTTTARKEDVLKVERYRPGGSGRGKAAAIGALIGFGGGFAVGAAVGGCNHTQIGPCLTRTEVGAGIGVIGAIVGAGIGAFLPHQHKDLIYSIK